MLQPDNKKFVSKIMKLRYGIFSVIFCGAISLSDSYADGFYVADLEREYYEEYVPAPPPRPRARKVYVYREPPRPRPQKVYVYREPPRPKPKKVYVYEDNPVPVTRRPERQYWIPGFFSQNNFLMFKLGGFKINGFGGNSEIKNSVQSYTFGLGVGHTFNDYVNGSLELDIFSKVQGEEFNKDQNALRKWDLSSNMLTANAAISLFPGQPVDFYLKVGLGMSNNKSGIYTWTSGTTKYYYSGADNYSFAWKSGFGMKVNTLPDLDTGLEYMFTNRGSFKTGNNKRIGNTETIAEPKEAKFNDHMISVVVSKKFS
ncbi:MAG: outer membrane beta-barrel protein [Rickettsiales bacterium]|nr:outer membrane beta-barrel protein [Rickettsiales bacterium]